jgi:cytoskeletal protein RodZ
MADLDACNEIADSLSSEIKNYQLLKAKDDQLIKKQADDNENLETQVQTITILKDSFVTGEKREKTKNKWVKGFATVFGCVAIIEAGYIWIVSRFIINN